MINHWRFSVWNFLSEFPAVAVLLRLSHSGGAPGLRPQVFRPWTLQRWLIEVLEAACSSLQNDANYITLLTELISILEIPLFDVRIPSSLVKLCGG